MGVENSPNGRTAIVSVPKVAVLTVNLNMASGLAQTIASVRRQTFQSIEFGIVDGGSSDGSQHVIQRNSDIIDWHVSENDRGIYDAMNKAVAHSQADWVIFLNSGDSFAGAGVLQQVFATDIPASIGLICGDTSVVYPDAHKRLWRSDVPERLPYGMICSHQALFARRSLLLELPFTVGKSASDYEFILAAWLRGEGFHRVPLVISEFLAGGISDRRRLRSLQERWEIIRRAGLATNGRRVYYGIQVLRAIAAQVVKGCLPPLVVRRLRQGIFARIRR